MRKQPNKLNRNDEKLRDFCWKGPRSVREIARYLNISPKNISVRLSSLEKAGIIKVERPSNWKKGMKIKVKTIREDKTQKYVLQILEGIKNKKEGFVTNKQYTNLIQFEGPPNIDKDFYDKSKAMNTLLYQNPPLIETCIRLTEEGKKFLRDKK